MFSSAQRYLSLIEPGKRGRWIGVIVFALVASGFEAAGAVLVYGLIGLTADPGTTIEIPILGDLNDLLPAMPQDELVVVAATVVGGFFVVRALAVLAERFYQARTLHLASMELSTRLFRRYLRLPYSFHLRRNSSELLRNANESVGEITGSIFSPTVKIISEGMLVLAVFAVLLATAPLATGFAALVLAPLIFVTLWVVQPRMKKLGRVSQRETTRSYQALQQGLHGYRDITVLGRQEFFLEVFRSSRRVIAKTRYQRAVLSELPRLGIETVVILFIAGFVAVSTGAGEGAQRSLPVLGLFAYAAMRIMPAVNRIVTSLNAIRFGRAAVDDVLADLELPILSPKDDVERLEFSDELQVQDVSFQYQGTEEATLKNLDLTIRRGESIGVVGPTGGGKSTLIDLLVGLSPPTTGRIMVDGIDLYGNEAAWQRNIGLVSQQVFLLDDTLRRNIALGIPDEEIDEPRVREAVRLAQLEDFIASLPLGLDATVGERGVRVSGGQRQRLAIARALYPQPSVLVFDEGTSALDNVTEAALIEALASLRQSHTLITVAHRLSTVQDYDRIVFIRAGRIDDVGRFAELGHRNEEFRRLARWSGAV